MRLWALVVGLWPLLCTWYIMSMCWDPDSGPVVRVYRNCLRLGEGYEWMGAVEDRVASALWGLSSCLPVPSSYKVHA